MLNPFRAFDHITAPDKPVSRLALLFGFILITIVLSIAIQVVCREIMFNHFVVASLPATSIQPDDVDWFTQGGAFVYGSLSTKALIHWYLCKNRSILRLERFFNLGGDEEGRTPDLCIANAALCQLSYIPDGWKFCHTVN